MKLSVTDALNSKISLLKPPERIVSLVPSVSYTLDYFGVDNQVVGITRFCKLPQSWRKKKTIIGGTKDIKIDRIKALQPDLIIANKEENNKEAVELLRDIAPVYVSDVFDFTTNNKFINDLGILLHKAEVSKKIIEGISLKLSYLQNTRKTYRSVYFIWQNPWMTVGGDTFIHQMMFYAGFANLYANQKRYPVTNIEELKDLKPEIVFLSSEPFPFKVKHQKILQSYLTDTSILLVEGEAFTWFGAYMLYGLDYLLTLKRNLK